jgi:hypothetical protein
MAREVGEGVGALTGAREREALVQVAAVQAGAGERRSQNPAAVEEVLKNLLDLKWYQKVGMVGYCLG